MASKLRGISFSIYFPLGGINHDVSDLIPVSRALTFLICLHLRSLCASSRIVHPVHFDGWQAPSHPRLQAPACISRRHLSCKGKGSVVRSSSRLLACARASHNSLLHQAYIFGCVFASHNTILRHSYFSTITKNR